MMNEKHVNEEQLVEMHIEPGAHPTRWEHVRGCPDCRRRSESLAAALELAKRFPVPGLHPGERARMFEHAWAASRRGHNGSAERTPWFPFAFLRHAASFGVGLACGMGLLFVLMSESSAGNTKPPLPEKPVVQPAAKTPEILRGSPGEKVFPKLENPVVVEQPKPGKPETRQRVLQGTLNGGSIQVIWNL